MITTVTIGSVTLTCNFVHKPKPSKIVRIPIPGRTGDIVQNLGDGSKRVELRGKIAVADEADKTTLEGYQGTTQTYTDSDESFTMIVEFVDIPTEGGNPNHFNFTVIGAKYDQV